MAERKVSNAEIKAGVFLTFCLALFVAMLFVLGKFGGAWRGKVMVQVAFTHVSALRPEAPVRYNGMEMGVVKNVNIVRVDEAFLSKLPVIARRDLENLPLSASERERLAVLSGGGAATAGGSGSGSLDSEARKIILGRTMVLLTLELLAENDPQRYRLDDEYRVTSSLMGDSAVEIRTGAGQEAARTHGQYLLGIGGDMYTDLGNSIGQVKDILASMSEMIGGDDWRTNIKAQVANFEAFSTRIESLSASMAEKLPETWGSMDRRLTEGRQTLNDIEAKAAKMKPELDQSMAKAEDSIREVRKNAGEAIQEAQTKVRDCRKGALEQIKKWRELTGEYRESVPAQIKSGRDWTDRFLPTASRLENMFARADDQLNKGIESTRTTLREYTDMASTFEESTYQLAKRPWSFAHKPPEEEARRNQTLYRYELARRHYQELRSELELARRSLGSADQARAERAGQLIREADSALDVKEPQGGIERAPAKLSGKGRGK